MPTVPASPAPSFSCFLRIKHSIGWILAKMTSRRGYALPRRSEHLRGSSSQSTTKDAAGAGKQQPEGGRPRQQRQLSHRIHDASASRRLPSSVMEVDEKKRQTSIQDFFFVKAAKNQPAAVPATWKNGTNGGIESRGDGSSRRTPLRPLNSNESEDSARTAVHDEPNDEIVVEAYDRGLPAGVDDAGVEAVVHDGRRVSMNEEDEPREHERSWGESESSRSRCCNDQAVVTQRAEVTNGSAPTTIRHNKRGTKRQYRQLFLDFGQRDFAKQEFCGLCGMMVVHGVEEDIRQHEKFCREYRLGVPFHCDTARVVAHPRPDSVIYQIRPGDSHVLRKKVDQVRQIVDNELGFVVNPSKTESLSTFLYTRNKRVVGLCSALPIQRGYVLAASNLERSNEPKKATIGVHQIWVHSQFRKSGVATALVDAIREKLFFGMVVPAGRVAYSSPSEAGASFARRYTQKASGLTDVLVYDVV